MQIVIEITEEDYKWVCDHVNMGYDLFKMIANGTPLPKGHGRLIERVLNAAETLKQKTGHWIPVSERLPKSSGVYIVSRWFSDGEERAILVDANYYDGNGDWYNDNRINWGRDLVTNRIVAWMPLPEPYKAESEDKE